MLRSSKKFFQPKFCMHFFILPLRSARFTHLLYLIIVVMFGDDYKLLSSLFCNCLQPPIISSSLGPYILLSTVFLNAHSPWFSLFIILGVQWVWAPWYAAASRPIVPAVFDRWEKWSIWWNDNWQGKRKYLWKNRPHCHFVHYTGRHAQKPANFLNLGVTDEGTFPFKLRVK
jgi:hypothetical protein